MQFYVIVATLCAVAHGRAFVKRQASGDPVLPIKPRRHWLYENSNFGRTIQGSNLSPWQFERAQIQPADSFVYWKTLDNDKTVFDSINEERPHFLDGTYNHRGGNVATMFGVFERGEQPVGGLSANVNYGNVVATPRRTNLFDEWRDGQFSRTIMRGAVNANLANNGNVAADVDNGQFPLLPPQLQDRQRQISQEYRQRISDPNLPLPQGQPRTDIIYEYPDSDPFAPLLP